MYIIIITANDEEKTIVGEAIEPGLQKEYGGRPDPTVCRSDGAR